MTIYELADWPNFTWNQVKLSVLLAEVRHLQGRLLGYMDALGHQLREEANLAIMIQDVLTTSEIEGKKLNPQQVRSSLVNLLGIDSGEFVYADRSVDGHVRLQVDAVSHADALLTEERLFAWHEALFTRELNGPFSQMTIGRWRTKASGAMLVVSGPTGFDKIHFKAPDSDNLRYEMARFLKWFNAPSQTDLLIKSAVAYFWFVTIHPFEDGNSRIGRAIANRLLARSDKTSSRFYSMSSQILKERNTYYELLARCQKNSTLDITVWVEWFLNCLKRAILLSNDTLQNILGKGRFWETHRAELFNERQSKIINLLLDGIDGNLTTKKWAKNANCSHDTALRDIRDLVKRQILAKDEAGGRSTHYLLNLPPQPGGINARSGINNINAMSE
jgi:Fic family protein